MSKYTEDFKLKVVKYCIEGHHGRNDAAKKFNIASSTPIKEWIRKYKEHGVEGLIKRQKSSYSGEFKQDVVEYMHNNHLSATETAIHFRLGATSVVLKWEHIYYEKGPQALYKQQCGRTKKMNIKSKNKNSSEEVEEALIVENERLRMENAYLKKLQALVQERIKPKQEKK